MSKVSSKEEKHIILEMTILDVVSRYRGSGPFLKNMMNRAVYVFVVRLFLKL